MASFTPGPWEREGANVLKLDANHEVVFNAEVMSDNANADAQLISAAPELLGLALEIREYLEFKIEGWKFEYPDNSAIILTAERKLEMCNAAIAKATGK